MQNARSSTNNREAGLHNRNVLVTGAAVRIGAAIARRLSREGAGVVLHYRSSEAEAKRLQDELIGEGGNTWLVQGDLVGEAACRAVIETAVREAGALYGLVNNASTFEKHAFQDISETTVLADFDVNLFAPIYLTRAFADVAQEGVVINLLDRRITANDPTCIPYLLAKKGLAEFTKAAAVALAPRIRVGGVCPGPVLPPPGEDRAYLEERAGTVPLQELPTPDHIAEAVVYLARQTGTTGQILYADGGQHLLGNGANP